MKMSGFDVVEKKNQIICTSCGAYFSIREPKCPYCGAFNPVGAEEEYMGKLHDIREDTEHLPDLAEDEVEEDLISSSKKALRFAGILLLIAFALIVLFTAFSNRTEKKAMDEYRAMEAFKEKYYDELDRLYEEEKDEELVEFMVSISEEPGYNALYNWEHYGYYHSYFYYTDLKDWVEEYSSSENPEDLTYAVYVALDLTRENYYINSPQYKFSERDMEKLEGYRAYAEDFLKKTLKMNSDEIDAWVKELKGKKGYIDRDQVKKYLREINLE